MYHFYKQTLLHPIRHSRRLKYTNRFANTVAGPKVCGPILPYVKQRNEHRVNPDVVIHSEICHFEKDAERVQIVGVSLTKSRATILGDSYVYLVRYCIDDILTATAN